MQIEYIRKQDAFDAFEARISELMTHPEFRRKHLDIDLSGFIRNISAIKPADVVPVVRCKDCKFRENDDFCTGRGFPYQLVPDHGFCDKGERKE